MWLGPDKIPSWMVSWIGRVRCSASLSLASVPGSWRRSTRRRIKVCEMVLDCVDRDARLDWHLDERADYYALLLLAAGADVAGVELVVAAHEPAGDDPGDYSTLPLDVLVRMGVRGSLGAQDALGRYLADGVDVAGVLWVLQGDGERTSKIPAWRSTMQRLGSVLCERFPSRVELRSALEETRESFSVDSDTPPWSLWASRYQYTRAADAAGPQAGNVRRRGVEGTHGRVRCSVAHRRRQPRVAPDARAGATGARLSRATRGVGDRRRTPRGPRLS